MAVGLQLYSLYLLLLVIDFPDQYKKIQIKTMFATNGIILTTIHWKISINLFMNSQMKFTVYFRTLETTGLLDKVAWNHTLFSKPKIILIP